jgi:hypothetical protein
MLLLQQQVMQYEVEKQQRAIEAEAVQYNQALVEGGMEQAVKGNKGQGTTVHTEHTKFRCILQGKV